MHIADFKLERYFAKWEFAVKHVLCASDAEPIGLTELLDLADDDGRRRWDRSTSANRVAGTSRLRDEIARLYAGLTAEDVVSFAGAEEGVFVSMHALVGPGDHIVVVWPAYQSLHEVARSIGASVTLVPRDAKDWSLDVDAVAASMQPNTKAIVINFPHSPTGAQIPADQLARLISIAELHGAHLFSDEVYRFLEHSAPALRPAAECSERAISLGVMSKTFGMGGARSGWSATRDRALRARVAAIRDYTTSAARRQRGAVADRSRDRPWRD